LGECLDRATQHLELWRRHLTQLQSGPIDRIRGILITLAQPLPSGALVRPHIQRIVRLLSSTEILLA
jgi:hypothetical protein